MISLGLFAVLVLYIQLEMTANFGKEKKKGKMR